MSPNVPRSSRRFRLHGIGPATFSALVCIVLTLSCQRGGERQEEIRAAAANGDANRISALLKGNPGLVSSKTENGWTPLHWAAERGYKGAVELLLANGAEVDARSDQGSTPLHRAANKGLIEVVRVLIANHADVNARNLDGNTPLHWAALQGHRDVAELLLANGANPNARNADGHTPLHYAAAKGRLAVAELLLAHKAEVNLRTNARVRSAGEDPHVIAGWTALGWAAENGHSDLVELLRSHGGRE